jgi:two-component system, cell cycle sensor histidine kinase and response regulator CckA
MAKDKQLDRNGSPPSGMQDHGGPGRTILFMDDEESILEAFGRLLTMKGYIVITARDGAEAVTLYKSAMEAGKPIDVAILDLTIPGGMGGIETIEKIKEIDPDVCALASSGLAHGIMAGYETYGFAGAIPKPYQWRDLISAIDRALKRK